MSGLTDRVVSEGWLPDPLLRAAIRASCAQRLRHERRRGIDAFEDAVAALSHGPIAVATDAANEQHYEVDPGFFGLVLGRAGSTRGASGRPGRRRSPPRRRRASR